MSQIKVREKFFDVTLTSNSYQDVFPDNTVSFFRAKLPAKLVLPQQFGYKVALYKLNYINSINNIGKGANTEMVISTDKYHGASVYFPDVCVDNENEFVKLMVAQMKQTVPDLFTNHPQSAIVLKPQLPFVVAKNEPAQADEPGKRFLFENDLLLSDGPQLSFEEEEEYLGNYAYDIARIIQDPHADGERTFVEFKIKYNRYRYVEASELSNKLSNIPKLGRKYLKFTIIVKNILGELEKALKSYIPNANALFLKDRDQDTELAWKNLKLQLSEKLTKQIELNRMTKEKYVFENFEITPSNHENIHEEVFLNLFKTFEKQTKEFDETADGDELLKTLFATLQRNISFDIETLLQELESLIDIHRQQMKKMFNNFKLFKKIGNQFVLLKLFTTTSKENLNL